jgi:hypothetical protein
LAALQSQDGSLQWKNHCVSSASTKLNQPQNCSDIFNQIQQKEFKNPPVRGFITKWYKQQKTECAGKGKISGLPSTEKVAGKPKRKVYLWSVSKSIWV